jgi:hypothetical protein
LTYDVNDDFTVRSNRVLRKHSIVESPRPTGSRHGRGYVVGIVLFHSDVYNMDFALYRGLDPILVKWYQACPVDVYIIGIYYVDVNIIGIDPKAEKVGYHMSPYCAMNDNPVTFSDPDGAEPITMLLIGAGISNVSNGQNFFAGAGKAAFWGGYGALVSFGVGNAAGGLFGAKATLGKALFQMGAHGLTQGGISAAQGGNFWQSALSSGISSGIGSGIDGLGGSVGYQILGGGVSGGISSVISGGNFWKGFQVGISVAAFNHALHKLVEESAPPKGKRWIKPKNPKPIKLPGALEVNLQLEIGLAPALGITGGISLVYSAIGELFYDFNYGYSATTTLPVSGSGSLSGNVYFPKDAKHTLSMEDFGGWQTNYSAGVPTPWGVNFNGNYMVGKTYNGYGLGVSKLGLPGISISKTFTDPRYMKKIN